METSPLAAAGSGTSTERKGEAYGADTAPLTRPMEGRNAMDNPVIVHGLCMTEADDWNPGTYRAVYLDPRDGGACESVDGLTYEEAKGKVLADGLSASHLAAWRSLCDDHAGSTDAATRAAAEKGIATLARLADGGVST